MKVLRSFGYAWFGLKHAVATQTNLRIHLSIAAIVISMGIGLSITAMEWMIVSICMGMVVFAELVNTALEKLSDVVQKDHHPEIKLVKDIAAAAVLILAISSAITGAIIFLPKIIMFIKTI
jgi:diacylglycerol kinase (ATP)